MPALSCSTVIAAPRRLVAGVVRDGAAATEALTRARHRYRAHVRLLVPGDEIVLRARLSPGVRLEYRSRIRTVSELGMTSDLVGGPASVLVHTTTLTDHPDGTVLRDEIRWRSPWGPLGRVADVLRVRTLVRDLLAARAVVYRERAEILAAAPVVVGAAVVRDGRVLAAQRARPPALAGRWELPGGRVEERETEPAALARELREELGADAEVGGRIGTDLPLTSADGNPMVLRMYTAALLADSSEPKPLEHREIRWLAAPEVPTLAWVDADRAIVADLVELLRG